MGASFSRSLSLGVSTSIAVICHEIPRKFILYLKILKKKVRFSLFSPLMWIEDELGKQKYQREFIKNKKNE